MLAQRSRRVSVLVVADAVTDQNAAYLQDVLFAGALPYLEIVFLHRSRSDDERADLPLVELIRQMIGPVTQADASPRFVPEKTKIAMHDK